MQTINVRNRVINQTVPGILILMVGTLGLLLALAPVLPAGGADVESGRVVRFDATQHAAGPPASSGTFQEIASIALPVLPQQRCHVASQSRYRGIRVNLVQADGDVSATYPQAPRDVFFIVRTA